ncbi:MAG: helix-turn-helix transcriptional regulator [Clostridiales bacterium]|nr:helix-turn-helix transcriptional regulator [Clostridiales bacterium]
MECKKFKGYMAEHDIKQAEIAEILGIAQENVNAKVNGRQEFTLAQVRILCQHYGIRADDFFV